MADVKISGLPSDSALDGNHYVPVNDPTGPTTKRTLLSTLAAFFFNQANIPSGSGSPVTRFDESFYDFIQTGLVWSGDAYASTRAASMTAGTVYINGRRILISAVTARTFTASKDTYVDVLDNGDGTGTLVYTEVANNAASPALAANSMRIAIIITGASNIANVGSVNQGERDKVLPIASSVAYTVTDSLGNLIHNRTPLPEVIGYRQITSDYTANPNGTYIDITGLTAVPFIAPGDRSIAATIDCRAVTCGTGGPPLTSLAVKEGATTISEASNQITVGYQAPMRPSFASTRPTAGLHTYKGMMNVNQNANMTFSGTAGAPGYVLIKLA